MSIARSGFAAIVLAFVSFAAPAQAQSDETLLLHNVRILHLDREEASVDKAMSILIEDGRIASVTPIEKTSEAGVATVIDGHGRFVMAGLTDMHVHIWDRSSLGAYLASGVTTVRNASGMPFHLRLADRIERGEIVGPRLITTGPILNSPGPNAQINHEMVTTAEEARQAVRRQYEAGFRRLKVYSNLTSEAYEAILHEAGRLGMTIMGHTPEGVRQPGMPDDIPFEIEFAHILEGGIVTIEHVESIVWHGLRDRHDADAGRELARQIAAAQVAVDPTLLAFYNLLRVAETQGGYLQREGTELLNPILVAQSEAEYERWSGENIPRNRAAFDFYKRMTRILSDEGVLLVAGSDAGIFTNVPGISLIEELELLEQAGLGRNQVLRAATINAAKALDEQDTAGRVAEGYRADLILLESDPSADLGALRSISAVVAGGRYLDRAALDRLLEDAAIHDLRRTQRNLVEALEAQGVDAGILQP
ncbi:amidohydrolase family protein [Citromicrobium bathyomarinum]|uniref:amidohydrolase family protein n=1 Tax=Citromicrobium bathyomarinum TaxID=72174 RepID=UPI00315A9729